jgi:predicted peptidase
VVAALTALAGLPPGAPPGVGRVGAPPGAGRAAGAGGTAITDQARLHEASEKDVMNVLDMVRKEFNVDENRIYLMGHSMGGAGAIYLGGKHASIWAAIGAEAPATARAGLRLDTFSLEPAKHIPMMIVQGDMDTLVPVAGARQWVEKMKELDMVHEYVEVAGGDRGSVLTTGAPDIFGFFAKHRKGVR